MALLHHAHQRTALEIRYAPPRGGERTLTLDLVDYPGEWLLDLPLLDMAMPTSAAPA